MYVVGDLTLAQPMMPT